MSKQERPSGGISERCRKWRGALPWYEPLRSEIPPLGRSRKKYKRVFFLFAPWVGMTNFELNGGKRLKNAI